ncbi:TetR/AcrR family transcriptional regulator [Streptomyces kronopolitis]|uniref:TetR family transcriptional regulator n=1 Tax=Streptomyces kronopolitis TaxID=1612435 RepID=A0ABQ2K4Y0_9ACTN|nr:TetR/AcrR family transcriptional regulator [Streptomyces kronopolitis]MCL6299823.1 TetR/AcrR family transcriptional regulator [Streptomyces kronopolitis]GGN63213.1 TetR family transcriptional regulator [Streptomyces kronopolitis]
MAAKDGPAGKRPNSVWLTERPAPRRKAEQPAGLGLDKIVAATVRLLDADGLAKFSMRRLAAGLGVTAMSVYWYVDTKDDLLELALDSVMGEMRLPDESEAGQDWRAHLRALAGEYRALLTGHPWVARLLGTYINVGPHSIAFSDASMRVMKGSGLSLEQIAGGLSAVFQFVYGFATIEGLFNARCAEAGMPVDEYFRQVMQALQGRPEFTELLENSTEVMAARGGATMEDMRDRDFAFALDLQIAGIEAMRDRPSH